MRKSLQLTIPLHSLLLYAIVTGWETDDSDTYDAVVSCEEHGAECWRAINLLRCRRELSSCAKICAESSRDARERKRLHVARPDCFSVELVHSDRVEVRKSDVRPVDVPLALLSCHDRLLSVELAGLHLENLEAAAQIDGADLLESWLRCDSMKLEYVIIRYGSKSNEKAFVCLPAECALDSLPLLASTWAKIFPANQIGRIVGFNKLPRPFDYLRLAHGSVWGEVAASKPFRSMLQGLMIDAIEQNRGEVLEFLAQQSMTGLCCLVFEARCWFTQAELEEMQPSLFEDYGILREPPAEYVKHCFSFLDNFESDPEPSWLSAELTRAKAVLNVSSNRRITSEALSRAEEESLATEFRLCRFEVRDGVLRSCPITHYASMGHIASLLGLLRILHHRWPLPEGLVFLVSPWDAVWDEFSAPVFVRCALRSSKSTLLLPSEFQTAPNYKLFLRKIVHGFRTPFSSKAPVAFWRGGNSEVVPHNVHPSEAARLKRPLTWTWENMAYFLRFRLVALSKAFPHMLNASFTSMNNAVPEPIVEWLRMGGYCCASHAGHDLTASYKYLVNVEATVGVADRFHWYMFTDSVVLQQESEYTLWLMHTVLRPGEHYLQFSSLFENLPQQIEWARTHEEEASQIAAAARNAAHEIMNEHGILLYLHHLLKHYAANFDFSSSRYQQPSPSSEALSKVEAWR